MREGGREGGGWGAIHLPAAMFGLLMGLARTIGRKRGTARKARKAKSTKNNGTLMQVSHIYTNVRASDYGLSE